LHDPVEEGIVGLSPPIDPGISGPRASHGRDPTFIRSREASMSIAKVTEITSSSSKSFDDAIRSGVARASKTLDNIRSAWIKEQKVVCDGENIVEYRVTMKVTFVLKV
jgi:hypothetical protein